MNTEFDDKIRDIVANHDNPRPTLTDAGRRWCEEHQLVSIMANVALQGSRGESSWPEEHIRAAIIVANEEGEGR